MQNISLICALLFALLFFIFRTKYRILLKKYAFCDSTWKKHCEKLQETIESHEKTIYDEDKKIYELKRNLDQIEQNDSFLHDRLRVANIDLVNKKGEILLLKQHKKLVSHKNSGFLYGVISSRMIFSKCKGWRVSYHGKIGYVAGWNKLCSEIILGFYEYTSLNNIAITTDCIMSRKEYVDYISISVEELKRIGWI